MKITAMSIRGQTCPHRCCARITIHSRKDRRFRCTACGSTWVERRHSSEFGLRKSSEQFQRAQRLITAGTSVRQTASLLAVSPTTIQRWKNRFQTAKLAA